MYWLLFYDLVDDYLERRAPLRDQHLGLANEYLRRGELVMAGALAEPADRAVLVFRTDDPATIEQFVQNDPYVAEGLVTKWTIRKWTVVLDRAG
jgi:uncharacterized protein YciI